jgi:hypothetical protein
LKHKFDLADRYKGLAKKRINELVVNHKTKQREENLLLVGVHFRGKDYASILKLQNSKDVRTRKFYAKAFQYFREKFSQDHEILFLVVTDDPTLANIVVKGKHVANIQIYYDQHQPTKFVGIIVVCINIHICVVGIIAIGIIIGILVHSIVVSVLLGFLFF